MKREIQTDPVSSRALWEFLLSETAHSERASTALNEVLASAVIDYITNNIARNDEYASVIGRRVAAILDAFGIEPPWDA